MGELGELRNRVDQAVSRLSEAHESRRQQSQGLVTLLADLEAKFEARDQEVLHCRQRIEALTRENADLSNLVEQLVQIVDNTVITQDEDALFRASATAAELVANWSGPSDQPETAATDEVVEDGVDETPSAPDFEGNLDDLIAAKLGYDPAAQAFAALEPDQGFQDVSQEELDSEELRAVPDELSTLLEQASSVDADEELSVEGLSVEELSVDEINEPFEVLEVDDVEMPAAASAENLDVENLDVDGIDMPEIDMTELEVIELETDDLDVSDSFDPVQEHVAADLDIPEIALEDEEPISHLDPDADTESSIRAMMARLEQAAARAKEHSDAAAESDPAPEAETSPAVAVGGSN